MRRGLPTCLALLLLGAMLAPLSADPAAPSALEMAIEPGPGRLAPVPRAWSRQGWKPVVPHAYAMRRRVLARARPTAGAPAVFSIPGGMRVPVVEQGRDWWRVGWTRGRSGWVRAPLLEPHASVVLIDVRRGRMLRRLAIKGQGGLVPDGRALWSVSNSGLTRTLLGPRPVIWSYPVGGDQFGSLPWSSAWTADRRRFVYPVEQEKGEILAAVRPEAGAVQLTSTRVHGRVLHLGAAGRVLLAQGGMHQAGEGAVLVDAERDRELSRAPGSLVASSRSGASYLSTGTELVRYDESLRPSARFASGAPVEGAALAADGRTLAVALPAEPRNGEPGHRLRLLDARTLRRVAALRAPRKMTLPEILIFTGDRRGGWWAVVTGEGEGTATLYRFDPRGRPHRVAAECSAWVGDPATGSLYVARNRDLLIVQGRSGRLRRVPHAWRHPLPRRYLPRPSAPEFPTHLEVSALTLSPDGRMLVLTEYLNGDPGA